MDKFVSAILTGPSGSIDQIVTLAGLMGFKGYRIKKHGTQFKPLKHPFKKSNSAIRHRQFGRDCLDESAHTTYEGMVINLIYVQT